MRNWIHYGLVVPARIAALVYGGLLILFAIGQRQYIYYPVKRPESELAELAGRMGLSMWRDGEGAFTGWRTRRSLLAAPAYRAVVFHGNAGFALHRKYFVDGFSAAGDGLAWEVLLFEYPGYGARAGVPSEPNIQQAAATAVEALLAEDERPLFLVGESLGSGVAAHIAARFPERVAGLLLVTPFTSLADVAAHYYPFLPVRWLLRERYDAAGDLARYAGPVAVLLAGRDDVIPVRFGQRLFDGYSGPKRLWVQEAATHNTLDYDPHAAWWREVTGFLLEQARGTVAGPPAPATDHFTDGK
ncbi:MAG: lysophospholipase [Verrucomicrobia bacterium]|nr:lysophospholipase [Verrucomicrobiota bacterium]MBU1909035.1 lysophospholipase [Verrucomicrobiota bacterium]